MCNDQWLLEKDTHVCSFLKNLTEASLTLPFIRVLCSKITDILIDGFIHIVHLCFFPRINVKGEGKKNRKAQNLPG